MTTKTLTTREKLTILMSDNLKEEEVNCLNIKFIRSQDQIITYPLTEEIPPGYVLTAWEVYKNFPKRIYSEIIEDGVGQIYISRKYPCCSLKHKREELGLTQKQLSAKTGINISKVQEAEDPTKYSNVHDLAAIAKELKLSPITLGVDMIGLESSTIVHIKGE